MGGGARPLSISSEWTSAFPTASTVLLLLDGLGRGVETTAGVVGTIPTGTTFVPWGAPVAIGTAPPGADRSAAKFEPPRSVAEGSLERSSGRGAAGTGLEDDGSRKTGPFVGGSGADDGPGNVGPLDGGIGAEDGSRKTGPLVGGGGADDGPCKSGPLDGGGGAEAVPERSGKLVDGMAAVEFATGAVEFATGAVEFAPAAVASAAFAFAPAALSRGRERRGSSAGSSVPRTAPEVVDDSIGASGGALAPRRRPASRRELDAFPEPRPVSPGAASTRSDNSGATGAPTAGGRRTGRVESGDGPRRSSTTSTPSISVCSVTGTCPRTFGAVPAPTRPAMNRPATAFRAGSRTLDPTRKLQSRWDGSRVGGTNQAPRRAAVRVSRWWVRSSGVCHRGAVGTIPIRPLARQVSFCKNTAEC